MPRNAVAVALAVAAATLAPGSTLLAHKPTTSRYAFSPDVVAVLEEHCAPCHRQGGPGPMPLRSYEDARPWADAMKDEVLARRMPPAAVEIGGAPLLGTRPLSAREIETIVDWARGGAPAGRPAAEPRRVESEAAAAAALEPDLEIVTVVLDEVRLASGESERTTRMARDLGLLADRDLAGWDLRPARADLLRGARLHLVPPAGGDPLPGVSLFLGSWIPGQPRVRYPPGSGRRLAAGTTLALELRHARPLRIRGTEVADRTTLELAFLKARPASEVKAIVWPAAAGALPPPGARLLGFYPPPGAASRLELIPREGGGGPAAEAPTALLDVFATDARWPITYRFATQPVIPEGMVLSSPPAHLREPGAVLFAAP